MRKLFVSMIALLFVSQVAISAESDSDKEIKSEKEKIVELDKEDSKKAVESETEQKAEKVVKEDHQKIEKIDKESKVAEVEKKEELKSDDSGKEAEKASEKSTIKENVKDITKTKNSSKDQTLPIVDSKDFLKNANSVLSCMNPEVVAENPITNKDGYVILLEISEDIANALIEKNADAVLKLLTKSENANPTIFQMFSGMLITAINDIDDETIEVLKKLNLIKNETFRSWLEKNDLILTYSSKIKDDIKKDQSFMAIPLVYSEKTNKFTFDISKIKKIAKTSLEAADQIQKSEKVIKEKMEERNSKITPEMQKNLDELKRLEGENEVLKKQIEDKKNSVSGDIEQNEKAKADAESMLNNKQSDLTNVQNELNAVLAQKSVQEARLNNFNNGKTRNAELRKMKNETGNNRLNINTAKAQTQEQINNFNNRIGELQNRIQTLETERINAENTIRETSEKITQFQDSINEIEKLKADNESKINKLKTDMDTTRALVYAGDIDKEIENNVDNSTKLFEQLLTA